MRALRTFVRQQSSQAGLASIAVATAVCILDVVMGTYAGECEANVRHMRAHVFTLPYILSPVRPHATHDYRFDCIVGWRCVQIRLKTKHATSVHTTKRYKTRLIN